MTILVYGDGDGDGDGDVSVLETLFCTTVFWVVLSNHFAKIILQWKNLQKKRTETTRGDTEFFRFLMSCNSRTARWKNFVPGLYCRALQELLNGAWNMGIGPREPKCATFCARHFLWALADGMHRSIHRRAHECLRVIGLEREVSRRVALSSGLCLEFYKWRMA